MSALREWWRRDRHDREVDTEFRFHLDRETEKWMATGVPADEARALAADICRDWLALAAQRLPASDNGDRPIVQ